MIFTKRQSAAQQVGRANRRHGSTGTPEHRTWASMRERCANPRSRSFARYGGRGIRVCDRWLAAFENFFEDMGKRPSTNHSIERIDNDGPYSPENCQWATRSQQQRNKRTARLVEWNGERVSLATVAERHGLSRATVAQRLKRGWSVDDALRSIAS